MGELAAVCSLADTSVSMNHDIMLTIIRKTMK